MASLALSVVGSAIGGPLGGMIGGMIGGLLDNVLFPASQPPPPPITTSTYGKPITWARGTSVRLGCNMIWTSGWRKQSGKAAKLAELKGLPPAFVTDLAFQVMAGPVDPDWVIKIFANGSVLFDSTVAATRPTPDSNGVVTWADVGEPPHGTHKDFDSLVVYPGNALQQPDPTIEAALGLGNTAAYRGTAYIVINGLVGTAWGNSVPVLSILASPNSKGIRLNQVVNDIILASGLDPTRASTSSLSADVQGYVIDSQTDGVTALQPLALVFNFDLAEVAGDLRFSPRGQEPLCAVISDQLAGHEYGGARPSFQWPRDAEFNMPKLAALTFIDPARDCQENTQSAKRETGSVVSMLNTSVKITMDTNTARQVADRMLWEAQIGRQTFTAAGDDRVGFLEAARTYAFQVPFGYENVRITKRTRGANNVIEIEGKRDASSVYVSTAPGADASSQTNVVGLGGPVNTPIIIEPSEGTFGITGATLLIALSGSSPEWGGCQVYVATDDVEADYQLVGLQVGSACMGVTANSLPNYGGSNPDQNSVTGHVLRVDTSESGGEPTQQSFLDASLTQTVCLVGTEFIAVQHVSAIGGDQFNLTDLWRGMLGSSRQSHSPGERFVQCDSALFRMPMAANWVGVPLFFRFVSAGETLSGVTAYTYTPQGVVAATSGSSANPIASEAITAGELVNLWSNSGVLSMRKADATDTTKPCNGFVKVAVAMGDAGVFFGSGQANDQVSSLTPGTTYYLAVGGGLTATAPSTTGQGVQQVGTALSATELLFNSGAMTAAP